MRDSFIETLTAAADKDPDIRLVSGDLGFGVFDDLRDRHPSKFVNAGVAEQAMTGIAAGLALSGKTVFTYSIANFSTLRCLEQIRNDICYHALPVCVVSVGAGLSYGPLGFSHHATEDLAIMSALPGLAVYSPCDEEDARFLTQAFLDEPRPTYLRLDRGSTLSMPPDDHPRRVGARELRSGSDVALIATGSIAAEALKAAERLSHHGLSVAVYAANSLSPFDHEILLSAAGTVQLAVTIEEHVARGGLGSIVAEHLSAHVGSPPLLRLGLPQNEMISRVGDQEYLRREYGLDAGGIEARVAGAWRDRAVGL